MKPRCHYCQAEMDERAVAELEEAIKSHPSWVLVCSECAPTIEYLFGIQRTSARAGDNIDPQGVNALVPAPKTLGDIVRQYNQGLGKSE